MFTTTIRSSATINKLFVQTARFKVKQQSFSFNKQFMDNTVKNKKMKLSESAAAAANHRNSQTANVNLVDNNICNEQQKRTIDVEYLDVPDKSFSDKKDYRVIKLKNGLVALLISDMHSRNETDADPRAASEGESEDDSEIDDEQEESGGESEGEEDENETESKEKFQRDEKMAACALSIGVGSFSDPYKVPGLAHFLEHMVFMGSEKYPQENEFEAYVKKHGGSDNACTDCERTTFYFDIPEKHLLGALDRFAQFFISPLLIKDAMTREREAVDSEFQIAIPSDSNRKEQIISSFGKDGHPVNKFMWGNLKTLKDDINDDELYEALHDFRKRHYSAHRMTLAIQAKLPLETLEEYVYDCFSNVPTNDLPGDDFSQFKSGKSFDLGKFQRMYRIKPVKDICQITLNWEMPIIQHLYKSKPVHNVSWIVGHEGKGSLISYLRKKRWALTLISGCDDSGFESNTLYSLFGISIVLTEAGYKNIDQVIKAIFSYLNMIRNHGPDKRICDEIRQIEEIGFRFVEETEAAENVEELAEDMQLYKSKDYITGSKLFFEYSPEKVQQCMDMLTPDNVNVIIYDRNLQDKDLDKTEPWFGTKYNVKEISHSSIEEWKTAEPYPEFHLPEPNIYITTNFDLIELPQNISQYPTKVVSDEVMDLWYRPDPKFRLPDCYVYFHLISGAMVRSVSHAVMLDIYVGILTQLLVEELYPATVADLQYKLEPSEKGVVLKLNGYNEKIKLVAEAIMKTMKNYKDKLTESLFLVVIEQLRKSYFNKSLKPEKLAKDVRLNILLLNHYQTIEKNYVLPLVTYDQFRCFADQFVKSLKVQSLIQGNLTQEEAISCAKDCIDIFNCMPILPSTNFIERVIKLPEGKRCCRMKHVDAIEGNSYIVNYYQSDIQTTRNAVIVELLMLLMEEPLYNQLRTLEQLGYYVANEQRNTQGVLGFSVTVCTPADKFSTSHVDSRIESFIKQLYEDLEKMSDSDLDCTKESLRKLKTCDDVYLKEEVSRNWAEIITEDFQFDRIAREVECIDSITLEDIKTWLKSQMAGGSSFKKLSVQIEGIKQNEINKQGVSEQKKSDYIKSFKYLTGTAEELKAHGSDYFIDNITEFKRRMYVYPVRSTTIITKSSKSE